MSVEADKELTNVVQVIFNSCLMFTVNALVNESHRRFIKECRDIVAQNK